MDWQKKSYTVSSGIHTLKWRYVKDDSGYGGVQFEYEMKILTMELAGQMEAKRNKEIHKQLQNIGFMFK